MKQLFFFVVLILVLGVMGFLYRYTLENPQAGTPMEVSACTLEAKMCPDGSSVGRVGPSCAFATCALPNVELPEAGIAFVIPGGYRADERARGADTSLLESFGTTPLADTGGMPNTILIRQFHLEEEETANDVMLRETIFDPSGLPAESMQEFTPVIVNGKTFQKVTIERFEGHVRTYYYLPRATDVLRIDVTDTNVLEWTNPDLDIDTLPAHRAVMSLLTSLQSTQ